MCVLHRLRRGVSELMNAFIQHSTSLRSLEASPSGVDSVSLVNGSNDTWKRKNQRVTDLMQILVDMGQIWE